MGCHSLFQGIFPTQGSVPISFISCIVRWILYHWATWKDLHYVTYLCMYYFLPHHNGNCKRADRYVVLFTDVSLIPVMYMTHDELSTNSCRREGEKKRRNKGGKERNSKLQQNTSSKAWLSVPNKFLTRLNTHQNKKTKKQKAWLLFRLRKKKQQCFLKAHYD